MRPFTALKMAVLLLGTGAVLLLAPASKAQSEISPDHFDGTDSWAVAAQSAHAAKHLQSGAKPQAQKQKPAQASTFQLAAAREQVKPAARGAAAVDRKRKLVANNPQKK